ncbi:MAG: CHASE2 domain-containing protein [Spirochaetota bacterium]
MANASRSISSKSLRALVVGACSGLLGVVLLVTGALDGTERSTWDWRVRTFAGPTDATDDIVIVLVDQESLELMSSQNGIDWPWPRSFYGYMLAFFQEAGAASVTLDIILEDAGVGVEDDLQLRAAAAEFGSVIYGVELLRPGTSNPEPWPDYARRPDLTVRGLDPKDEAEITFSQASFPHEDVTAHSGTIAFVNQGNDEDGVFRRYRLLNYHLGQPVPGLGLAPLIAATGETLDLRFENRALYVGETRVPVSRDGTVLLKYTTPGDWSAGSGSPGDPLHRSFPAFDVVISGFQIASGGEPTIDTEPFRGRHVFIGPSASGLLDLRPTPLASRAPGVSVHATMLDNLLSGEFMRDAPIWFSAVFVMLVAAAAAYAATYARRTMTEILILLGFVVAGPLAASAAYLLGFWLPLIVVVVTGFVAVAAANVANYATEGAQKRFISSAFGTYVSPAVVDQLVQNPAMLKLGGEKRELSMFFSDIQGFTTLSEGLSPEQLSGFLNHYLTELVSIIQDLGGTIDKFEGDAIIAFWNAPLEVPSHPERAVEAALLCQRRLGELRPHYAEPVGPHDHDSSIPGVGRDIYTRIGLHTAEVSVGNFGSRTRFDYTALGDGMNLASRLEGANKVFGTYVMVSRATKERLNGAFPVRELGRIAVVGRNEPVTVYEPMLPDDYRSRADSVSAYEQALHLWYNNRLDEARDAFAAIADVDVVARGMVMRCDEWLAKPTEARSSWTGVVSLTEK